jgi:SET domain
MGSTSLLKYAAHSCDPNAYFKDQRRWLYARKDIAAGHEVTFDYLDKKPVISHPFFCNAALPTVGVKSGEFPGTPLLRYPIPAGITYRAEFLCGLYEGRAETASHLYVLRR